jgi:hypothetical protein
MDNEGHKSQQDVVGEVKKHPWEEKPEVVVPTSESERAEHAKINDLEKKKARRQKRQARKTKFFGFVKGHKVLSALIGVAIIAAIAGAIVGVVMLINSQNKNPGQSEQIGIVEVEYFPEGMTVTTAETPERAYSFVINEFVEHVEKGFIHDGIVDYGKLEDNYNAFVNSGNHSDYEKSIYELYYVNKLILLGKIDEAKARLDMYKEKEESLDHKQRYFYLIDWKLYYYGIKDTENAARVTERIEIEFPEEENYFDEDYNLITDKSGILSLCPLINIMSTNQCPPVIADITIVGISVSPRICISLVHQHNLVAVVACSITRGMIHNIFRILDIMVRLAICTVGSIIEII